EVPFVQFGSVTLRLDHWLFNAGYYTGQRAYKADWATRPSTHTITAIELLRYAAHYNPDTTRYTLAEDELACLESHLGEFVGYLLAALFPEPTQKHDTKRGKKRYPNKLKTIIEMVGFTITELGKETNIPRGTLYHWSAGRGIIPHWAR